ncbi:MAG: glycosyltransferase family 9 protein [Bacteroidia bacterium]|nr:glycosyltransferase family 9 protein [Bacteroidia bacterium]
MWHWVGWKARLHVRTLAGLADGFLLLRKPPTPSSPMPSMAFIRMDGIGDFWLTLPFISALRQAYPYHYFVLIANEAWADLAEYTKLFDRVLSLSPVRLRHSFSYRRRALKILRQTFPPIETLWQPTAGRRLIVEDLLAWAIPAARRITRKRDKLTGEPCYLPLLDKWVYQEVYPLNQELSIHEWLRYQQWLNEMGLGRLDFTIYARMRERLLPFYSNGHFYIAIVLGAQLSARRMPFSLMVRLIRTLHERTYLPIQLIGTQSEQALAQALVDQLRNVPIEPLIGRLSLVEAAARVMHASFVIAPETGLAHIAATANVPTLILAGGGHWGRFIPYPEKAPFRVKVLVHPMPCFGCNWLCYHQFSKKDAFPCIRLLESGAIEEEIVDWLSATLGAPLQSAHG